MILNRNVMLVALTGALLSGEALSNDEWRFGVGTGIGALEVDGDAGFNTRLLGPVEFDASLEPDEVQDYLDSAFSLGLVATKGDLAFSFSLANLELADDVSAKRGANRGTADIEFKTQVVELTGEYTFARFDKHSFGAVAGARFTKQEYGTDLFLDNAEVFSGSVDDDWTDALLGASYTYAFSPTFFWSNQLMYGFGGSEGTSQFNTGLSKIFGTSWLFRLALDYKDIEYEEGDRGDSDWFYYDATETTLGLSVLYLF